MQIADIMRGNVQRWFASLYTTPAAADRAATVLSVLMKQAELPGYRPEGSNPCVGIRRCERSAMVSPFAPKMLTRRRLRCRLTERIGAGNVGGPAGTGMTS